MRKLNNTRSKSLFNHALELMPGGVNSPVRAFRSVGGDPLFIARADGPYMYDADGNAYIDLINSWGPMILGHNHPKIRKAVIEAAEDSLSFGAPGEKEVLIAEKIIKMVPSVEKVRMVNSGTEATMSAIRVARGYTGRKKIIKFEGCYHGHGDSFLISAGSGAATMGVPDSPGVTPGTAQDTLNAIYNDIDSVVALFEANPGDIAAVIVEPVAGNMGCIPPIEGFLEGLRQLCIDHDSVLIFDEVMTGFRLARGGAQELYGVIPDMTTLGKIIGGGMPVGAYGGKKEIMEKVAPAGSVYQAGTLSGNPVSMSAGLTMLNLLDGDMEIYSTLEQITNNITGKIESEFGESGIEFTINQVGSMFSVFFRKDPVKNFADAVDSRKELFTEYFWTMLENGIYLPPSPFESAFVSITIGDKEMERLSTGIELSAKALKNR